MQATVKVGKEVLIKPIQSNKARTQLSQIQELDQVSSIFSWAKVRQKLLSYYCLDAISNKIQLKGIFLFFFQSQFCANPQSKSYLYSNPTLTLIFREGIRWPSEPTKRSFYPIVSFSFNPLHSTVKSIKMRFKPPKTQYYHLCCWSDQRLEPHKLLQIFK